MIAPKRLFATLAVAALTTLGATGAHARDYYYDDDYDPPQVFLNITYSDNDAHIYGNRHSYRPPHRHSHGYDGYARPHPHPHYRPHHRPDKEFCEIRPGRPGKPQYRP